MDNRFFNSYPYTDFHELNLSWVISELRSFATTLEQFVSINALKYADPIDWNITTQYEKNTIVIDSQTGTAYISVSAVPAGVSLTNTDYWTVVFDLSMFIVRAAQNFTDKWEQETNTTATFPIAAGDWFVWGDVLYRAKINIAAGDTYVIDSNIEHFTMEDIIGHLEDLNTTDKTNLVAAINDVLTIMSDITGDLNNLITPIHDNLVNAINSAYSKIKVLNDYPGDTDTEKLQNAFDALYDPNTPEETWGGVILVDRMYDLTADIDIKINTNRGKIYLVGTGKNSGFNLNGHKFYSTGLTRSFGGLSCSFLRFNGLGTDSTPDSSVVFDCDTLIRLCITNCFFYHCGTIFKSTAVMQQTSVKCTQFWFSNKIIDAVDVFQCSLDEAHIETCFSDVISISGRAMAFALINSTIESVFDGVMFKCLSALGVSIKSNYIEEFHNNSKPVIDLSNFTGSIDIADNYFQPNLDNDPSYCDMLVLLNTGSGRLVNLQYNQSVTGATLVRFTGTNTPCRHLRCIGNAGFTTIIDPNGTTTSVPVDVSGKLSGCTFTLGQEVNIYVNFYMPQGYATFPFDAYNHTITITNAWVDGGTSLNASHFNVINNNTDIAYIRCTDATTMSTIEGKTVRFTITMS